MPTKEHKVQRASFEKLLDVANQVRAAGGGNPLDALMPAVPQDPSQCLIAKNLNFNCEVCQVNDDFILADINGGDRTAWCMMISDKVIRDKIAESLGWSTANYRSRYSSEAGYLVFLPEDIGQVAADFDAWQDIFYALEHEYVHNVEYHDGQPLFEFDWNGDCELTREEFIAFLPYVESSIKELEEIGMFNKQGELIL